MRILLSMVSGRENPPLAGKILDSVNGAAYRSVISTSSAVGLASGAGLRITHHKGEGRKGLLSVSQKNDYRTSFNTERTRSFDAFVLFSRGRDNSRNVMLREFKTRKPAYA